MNELRCPRCMAEVPLEDVNVAKDVALCRRCQESFSFAESSNEEEPLPQVDLDHPPKGVWFHRTADGFELGSTTRSWIAVFLVPFMCLWSAGSLGATFWPQIRKGEFSLGMSLFGLPFLIGTIVIGAITIMCVCGKICVRARDGEGEIFVGVGRLGFRRRFKWNEIKSVRQLTRIGSKGQRYKQLCLEAEKPITIATNVAGGRMQFFAAALKQLQQEFLPVAQKGAKPPVVQQGIGPVTKTGLEVR